MVYLASLDCQEANPIPKNKAARMGRFKTGTTSKLFRWGGGAGPFALLVLLAAFVMLVFLAFGGCGLVTGLTRAALGAAAGLRKCQARAEDHCAQ